MPSSLSSLIRMMNKTGLFLVIDYYFDSLRRIVEVSDAVRCHMEEDNQAKAFNRDDSNPISPPPVPVPPVLPVPTVTVRPL